MVNRYARDPALIIPRPGVERINYGPASRWIKAKGNNDLERIEWKVIECFMFGKKSSQSESFLYGYLMLVNLRNKSSSAVRCRWCHLRRDV